MGETFWRSVYILVPYYEYIFLRQLNSAFPDALSHYVMDAMFTLKNRCTEKIMLSMKWKKKKKEGTLARWTITPLYLRLPTAVRVA